MKVSELVQFRLFLDRLDPSDREGQLLFFRMLSRVGEAGVGDLRARMLKANLPKELRLLFMEAAYYHPLQDWHETLRELLRRETDPAVFTVGVWVLGRLGQEAHPTLEELLALRPEPEFRDTLTQELARTCMWETGSPRRCPH